jgi:8-oxo-dGTP pyrophosphatase MutT (NUDIX family)
MTDARKPKAAATIILLRPAPGNRFEVFLTRRPDNMPVLGGMYCYPGGTVSRDDCSPHLARRCAGLTPDEARKIIGAHYAPLEAIGFWVAGVRELFEEIGVLLATGESGAPFSLDEGRAERLAARHAALLSKSISFFALLESERLVCDLARLAHFSYWQTPSPVPARFATRFFIAQLPAGQTPLATSYEVAHSLWLTPDRAMQLHGRGELPLIFPTFATLRTLADFDTLEGVLREYGAANLHTSQSANE